MIPRRTPANPTPVEGSHVFAHFHDWVLSLPWVVERPYSLGTQGVRAFGVECELLDLHKLWLVTGMQPRGRAHPVDIAVIIPDGAARTIEDLGWARPLSPMPARQVLMKASSDVMASPREVEALVVSAYTFAMS